MKSRLLILLMLITSIFSLNLKGEKVCNLNEVMKLEQLIIDNDYAYLAEEFKIHIYSMKNKKLITSFGKKGEGPGEFPYKRNILPLKYMPLAENKRIELYGLHHSLFSKQD